jgi:DNA ligase-associated metallophosphoesterase
MAKPSGATCLTLGKTALWLLPEKAVLWDRTLFVADVHLEKASFFQRQGFAVPKGSDAEDLERLRTLLHAHGCERLVVLGDFFHRPLRPGSSAQARLEAWLTALGQAGVSVHLVAGNHDGAAPQQRSAEGLHWEREGWRLGPLSCRHEPLGTSEEPTLAGHLHPGYRLRAARKSSFYGPVFWRRGQELVLPAFGSLTGTLAVRPGPGDALFLVAEGVVHPLHGG